MTFKKSFICTTNVYTGKSTSTCMKHLWLLRTTFYTWSPESSWSFWQIHRLIDESRFVKDEIGSFILLFLIFISIWQFQAAILQQTAEYIYQLEQEKTRLLLQKIQLKKLTSWATSLYSLPQQKVCQYCNLKHSLKQ